MWVCVLAWWTVGSRSRCRSRNRSRRICLHRIGVIIRAKSVMDSGCQSRNCSLSWAWDDWRSRCTCMRGLSVRNCYPRRHAVLWRMWRMRRMWSWPAAHLRTLVKEAQGSVLGTQRVVLRMQCLCIRSATNVRMEKRVCQQLLFDYVHKARTNVDHEKKKVEKRNVPSGYNAI